MRRPTMVDEMLLLRRADPARQVGSGGELDDRARADLQRLLLDDGSHAGSPAVPFVPAPLQARTVRRRGPVALAAGQRWSVRRRASRGGAARGGGGGGGRPPAGPGAPGAACFRASLPLRAARPRAGGAAPPPPPP